MEYDVFEQTERTLEPTEVQVGTDFQAELITSGPPELGLVAVQGSGLETQVGPHDRVAYEAAEESHKLHERVLTPREAARLLGVHVRTLSRNADEGLIPFTKTLGGHRRYLEGEILKARKAASK